MQSGGGGRQESSGGGALASCDSSAQCVGVQRDTAAMFNMQLLVQTAGQAVERVCQHLA